MRSLSRLGARVLAGLACTIPASQAAAQDYAPQYLPTITSGNLGGTRFQVRCPRVREVLVGLGQRYGIVIFALGLVCREVHPGGTLGDQHNYPLSTGGFGFPPPISPLFGTYTCPPGAVVVGHAGIPTIQGLAGLTLECRRWDIATKRWTGGPVAFIGIDLLTSVLLAGSTVLPPGYSSYQRCSRTSQPAKGIHGRENDRAVAAVGVFCDEP